MKGIILAGGNGSRLAPVTNIINKHLLPVFNKPMIFYSLSLMILSGVDDILLICNKNDLQSYKKLLKPIFKKNTKIKIKFKIQKKPEGILAGLKISKNFILNSEKFMVMLGDNFFYGEDLPELIKKKNSSNLNHTFLYKVRDPWNFGNVLIQNKKIIRFKEKSKKKINNYAVTGLYLLKKNSLNYLDQINKSLRGEYEITSLLNKLLLNKDVDYSVLGQGTTWYDMGTFENINEVSNYISLIEKRIEKKVYDLNYILKNFKN